MTAADAAQALGVKVPHPLASAPAASPPIPSGMSSETPGTCPCRSTSTRNCCARSPTGPATNRATDTAGFRQIYEEIDRLEKTEAEVKKYQRCHEVFSFFAVPGFVLFLMEIVLGHTVWRKLP